MERSTRQAIKGFIIVVVLLLCAGVHGAGKGGLLLRKSAAGLDCGANLVSNGGEGKISEGFIAKVLTGWKNRDLESSSCEETYGFLPCTSSVLGNLFLLAAYGYLLYYAAKFMSDGSEVLLAVTGPGIIGGLFLPVLGSFPDALLVLGKESSPPSFLVPYPQKNAFFFLLFVFVCLALVFAFFDNALPRWCSVKLQRHIVKHLNGILIPSSSLVFDGLCYRFFVF